MGEGDQPCAMYSVPVRNQTPDGTLWCLTCRRPHPVPRCEVCGVELRDLPHRLVLVCEPCKAAKRTFRNRAQRDANGLSAPLRVAAPSGEMKLSG